MNDQNTEEAKIFLEASGVVANRFFVTAGAVLGKLSFGEEIILPDGTKKLYARSSVVMGIGDMIMLRNGLVEALKQIEKPVQAGTQTKQ